MKTIRLLTPILLLLLLTAATAWSSGKSAYNYIPGDELETRLRAEEKLFLLDIQVEEEFGKHHIKGAFPTYAQSNPRAGVARPFSTGAEQLRNKKTCRRKGKSRPVRGGFFCPRPLSHLHLRLLG